MSLKVSAFVAVSLDGFIARSEDELDWLDEANSCVSEGEDCGYNAFMDSVDILVMGRKTYEKVILFKQWPYLNKQVIVLSSKKIDIPEKLSKTVSYSFESPDELCQRLDKKGIKHIYVDGGVTIGRFLGEGLLDEITITLIPIVLGRGKSLFNDTYKDISFRHISTKTYDFGFVQIKYEVLN